MNMETPTAMYELPETSHQWLAKYMTAVRTKTPLFSAHRNRIISQERKTRVRKIRQILHQDDDVGVGCLSGPPLVIILATTFEDIRG